MSDSVISLVREAPPTRLHATIETPDGRTFRWGSDEHDAANVLGNAVFSSTMPGGFENGSCTLARNPAVDYADLKEFSTLTFRGVGGQIAGEYRLEETPRSSGNQMAITPQAVGWQAHLADDNSAAMIYLDQALSNWGDMPLPRQTTALAQNYSVGSQTIGTDAGGNPALILEVDGAWTTVIPLSEAWYDSGMAGPIGKVYYAMTPGAGNVASTTAWREIVFISNANDGTDNAEYADLVGQGAFSGVLAPATAKRYAYVRHFCNAQNAGMDGFAYQSYWRVAAIGNHGLPIQGTWPETWNASTSTLSGGIGLLASDIVKHAVSKWAPLLRTTDATGASTITPSTFSVPQAAYLTPTTVSQIVTDLTAYDLQDWGVWERKTFFWYPRNARGRRWRTRVNDCQLQETGPQSSRIWNGVIVSYQDVTGVTRTVGPPGSGAEATDASLLDTDPDNPANAVLDASGNPMRRWSPLAMSSVTTQAGAIQVGAVFLQEQKLLDTSGNATLVGVVEDEFGVLHPTWAVRAGDQLAVVDSSDTSYRRIVSAEYTDSSKTNAVSLDSPPDGLQALLDRLGVVIAPLGFS